MTALKKTAWLLRRLCGLHDALLLTGFAVLIVLSGYCVYDSVYVYMHTLGEDLKQYKPVMQGTTVLDSPISDDMVGWLTIDGTSIDYPVMQGRDNFEYLNKDPYGNFSFSGSIYLDCHNSGDFSDGYSLLYGHHMAYGKMFGALDAYLDPDYARLHTRARLVIGRNADQCRELEIFAVMTVKATAEEIFHVETEKDTADYVCRNADLLLSRPEGAILALSTCADSAPDDRVVVLAYFKDEAVSPPQDTEEQPETDALG